ncbi:MAG: outer membrane beta-barrel protein [Acetobacteraceae bacterium]|nr:outer membrane beta-barrel protein [Acetobacteraceae bacterium]
MSRCRFPRTLPRLAPAGPNLPGGSLVPAARPTRLLAVAAGLAGLLLAPAAGGQTGSQTRPGQYGGPYGPAQPSQIQPSQAQPSQIQPSQSQGLQTRPLRTQLQEFQSLQAGMLAPGQSSFLRSATSPYSQYQGLLRSVDPDIRRGVTVANRPRPEYDPPGLRYGSVIVRPLLNLDAMYDTNILATGLEALADTVFITNLAAEAATDWSTHEIKVGGYVDNRRYAEYTDQDTTSWRVNASGRFDISRFQSIDGRVSAGRIYIPRNDVENIQTATPVAVDEQLASLGYTVRENRAALRLQGVAQSLRYPPTTLGTPTGLQIPFDQAFRNRDNYIGSAGVFYEVAPLRSAVVIARVNRRQYVEEGANAGQPNGPLARSSTGYEILGGVDADYNGIFGFRLLVGWLQQFYEDERLPNVSAPTFEAAVLWNPTTLTSLRFAADRRVAESITPGVSSYLVTNIGATVDHEIARNVLLNAGVGYRISAYENSSRTDYLLAGTLGATWLLNRNLRLGATYVRQNGDGQGPFADYDRNQFMIRLTGAL